ncbi:hypothetical protein HK17_11940 [Acetobacter indonesiensis]|uniref:Uncharacterized protein n=1 Tax=Acetobacter indonesiensis TaxID=104101 RepID=A0A252AXQ7_9PROT|nr:hypothetical protein HK17_11940 [Acetobacter indonesiensis]
MATARVAAGMVAMVTTTVRARITATTETSRVAANQGLMLAAVAVVTDQTFGFVIFGQLRLPFLFSRETPFK